MPLNKGCEISHPLLIGSFKYVKPLKTFRKKAKFLKRTNLIQNRTVHRQIAQRNDARVRNNSVGQREDPKNLAKKGVTCFFSLEERYNRENVSPKENISSCSKISCKT